MHKHWTPWRVVRLLSEVELPTLVDGHGLDKSRGGMLARFSRPDLADSASPVLLPRLACWAIQETVQVVEPVFVVGRGVAVEEVCLVVRLVVAVVGIGLELTHKRLVGEEADFEVVPDRRGVFVAGFQSAVVEGVPIVVGRC